MTKDDIIGCMADVGLKAPASGEFIFIRWDQLARLIEHERKEEREACAKTAESLDDWANDPYETATIREIAALIRARGNSEN